METILKWYVITLKKGGLKPRETNSQVYKEIAVEQCYGWWYYSFSLFRLLGFR